MKSAELTPFAYLDQTLGCTFVVVETNWVAFCPVVAFLGDQQNWLFSKLER